MKHSINILINYLLCQVYVVVSPLLEYEELRNVLLVIISDQSTSRIINQSSFLLTLAR